MSYSQVSPNYSIHFPLTLRKSLPKLLCPVLVLGLPFPRAGGCSGCQDSGPGCPLPCCPHCYWSIHIWTSLTPTACLDRADCLTVVLCQPARHLTRPTCCLPDIHHLIIPEAPITCPTRTLCLVLAFLHLASVPGSDVQNPMCCDRNDCLHDREHGVCRWPFSFVSQLTHFHHMVCVHF